MELQNFFLDLHKMQTHLYPLRSIILNKPLQTSTERTVRIIAGHLVCVQDGQLIDCSRHSPATHEVMECKGTLGDTQLLFILRDLKTNELLTLNVK